MKVLVIDDNEDMTDAISFYLTSINIECKITNDGREGLDIIRNDTTSDDVILLDLAMPEFNGFDVFSALKEEGLLKVRNVIIFTASNLSEKEIGQMLADGARSILRKPLSVDELEQTIKPFV
jgi:DNA-binding response OmpR family regulator